MMSSEMMSSEAMPPAPPKPVFDFTAPKACCVIGIDKTPEAVKPPAPAPTPTPTPAPSHYGHHGQYATQTQTFGGYGGGAQRYQNQGFQRGARYTQPQYPAFRPY